MPIVSPAPVPVLLAVSANPAEQAIGTVLVPMGYNPHCRQWGYINTNTAVTFPVEYPNAAFFAGAIHYGTNAGVTSIIRTGTLTKTGCTVGTSAGGNLFWWALGY